MAFSFISDAQIPDLIIVECHSFMDSRGFFMETYKATDFLAKSIPLFVQENHSFSTKGVLRGLHFQKAPHEQGKLVRCLSGEIFDVAVDIRPSSKTYKKWSSFILSSDNKKQVYIPAGFAHGFMVTSDKAEVVYKCTSEYAPQFEGGLMWNDPELGIKWPLSNPVISEKDTKYTPLV